MISRLIHVVSVIVSIAFAGLALATVLNQPAKISEFLGERANINLGIADFFPFIIVLLPTCLMLLPFFSRRKASFILFYGASFWLVFLLSAFSPFTPPIYNALMHLKVELPTVYAVTSIVGIAAPLLLFVNSIMISLSFSKVVQQGAAANP